MTDAKFREELNQLGFICYVGSLRFKVCLDKVGLCRFTYSKKKIIGIPYKKVRHEEFISFDENKRLVDADTKCYTEETVFN